MHITITTCVEGKKVLSRVLSRGTATPAYDSTAPDSVPENVQLVYTVWVQRSLQEGESARSSLLSWFPEAWVAGAMDGEPDRTLLQSRLVEELSKQSAGSLEAGAKLTPLKHLLYVSKPPTSIAPGALVAD